MEISAESVLALLAEREGGRISNSDLLSRFKEPLNCRDPAEKKRNRNLFKMIINDLAVVKTIEETKYIVLRKKYQHLLKLRLEEQQQERGGEEEEEEEQERGGAEEQERGGAEEQERGGAEEQERGGAEEQERGGAEEQERGGAEEQERGSAEEQERGGVEEQERGSAEEQERGGVEEEVEPKPAAEHREVCESEEGTEAPPEENKLRQNPPSDADVSPRSPTASFIELALQRQKCADFKVKKSLQFNVPLRSGTGDSQKLGPACSSNTETSAQKRFALPLRMPPVAIRPVEHGEMSKMKTPSSDNNPVKVHLASLSSMPGPPCSPRYKRRSSADSVGIGSSPQPQRHCKSAKPAEEPRYSDSIPLEISEHQWMVTSASGRWGLVYGLLLNDAQLAEKKDFISGFTALHWAAKCGNRDMLCKIIDLSRENGKGVDVNTKSYAGYTPLHIAAIHGQEYIIAILVNEYSASCNIRDNSGKKAHHYLDENASYSIRELLGGLKEARIEPQKNPEDTDAHKHTHTISRLFQPQTIGYKKKPKSRHAFLSMAEDSREEKGEHSNPVHRVFSDVFS